MDGSPVQHAEKSHKLMDHCNFCGMVCVTLVSMSLSVYVQVPCFCALYIF